MQAVATADEEPAGDVQRVTRDAPVPLIWRHMHLYHLFAFAALSIVGGLMLSLMLNCAPIDGLFTATSALSLTGLLTLDATALTGSAKVLIIVLMCVGSTLFVSLVPLAINYLTLRRAKSHSGIALSPSRDVYLEQAALAKLLLTVPLYFAVHLLVGFLLLLCYAYASSSMQAQMGADNLSAGSTSFFLAVSSLTNTGISPFRESLIPMQSHPLPLLIVAYLIFAGNVGFPIFLRLILAIRMRLSHRFSQKDNDAYAILLEHPRSFYTHLFDRSGTRDLLIVTSGLVAGQTVLTLLFEWRYTLGHLSFPLKFTNAFFEALSIRTAGFASFDITAANPAIQVMQLGLMFVSALPIALSIISTRPTDSATTMPSSRREVARQSFLHTIQFDLLLIIGALFGIAGIEAASRDPVNLWRTLYEVVSAYGTVGLSLSPVTQSFSATFSGPSKAMLMVVMIAGRMRALGLGSMKLILCTHRRERRPPPAPHHALSVPSDSADSHGFEMQVRPLSEEPL